MLAEIFMMRMEAAANSATETPKGARHVPFDTATFGGFKTARRKSAPAK